MHIDQSKGMLLALTCNKYQSLITKFVVNYYNFCGKPSRGGLPLFFGGLPSRRKKGGMTMITYSEFIQTGIFIVALVGLCHTIFKGRK